jgi:hypothetical protein
MPEPAPAPSWTAPLPDTGGSNGGG